MELKFIQRFGSGKSHDLLVDHTKLGPRQIKFGLQRLSIIASLVDPNTKGNGILKECHADAYELLRKEMIPDITAALSKTFDHVSNVPVVPLAAAPNVKASVLDAMCEETYTEVNYATALRHDTLAAAIEHVANQAIHEWMAFKRLDPNLKTNPLLWWKENCLTYPYVAMVAKKVLCIPATAASSERMFSDASETISKKRNRLDPDIAGDLMVLNDCWDKWIIWQKLSSKSV